MIGSRFYFAGLASILALSTVGAPGLRAQSPGTCNVIAPSAVDQEEVRRLGRVLVTGGSFQGQLDIQGNVTDVVQIDNLTPCPVRIEKLDGLRGAGSGTQAIQIGPGETFTGSMWVPWGDSGDTDRNMQILIQGESYFRIWQRGHRVAFRTIAELERLPMEQRGDGNDSAPSVPGEATEGGRRHLYIAMTSDGRPYFKFEAIQSR